VELDSTHTPHFHYVRGKVSGKSSTFAYHYKKACQSKQFTVT